MHLIKLKQKQELQELQNIEINFLKDIEQNKDGKVKILDNGDGLFISHEVISTLSSLIFVCVFSLIPNKL